MKNLLLALFVLLSNITIAQKAPLKWGKVSQEEVDLNLVEFDSSAKAVVLCDYGRMYIDISDGLIFRRHVRIKILDESAKDNGDFSIPYLHKDGAERILSINAQTINVENGKPKKFAISKKDFFRVKRNESVSDLKFSFPNIKAGSILEYSYSLESKYITSPDPWYFQSKFPTLKSYLFVSIGGALNYSILYQGRSLVEKYGKKSVNTWELNNLPAFKDEPYCPNPGDYTDKIQFQLSSYMSNIGKTQVMGTWKSVAQDLYDDGGLKSFLKQNKDATAIVETIVSNEDSDRDKVKKIYDYVISNYTWNEKYRMFPNEKYKDFKTKAAGSSSEINLFFINLLQAAGLEATPTLVSTKGHGLVARHITFYNQFNNLIACVKLDQKDVLINATNKYHPFTLLNATNLNREALVLDKKDPYWVDIVPFQKTRNVKLITMEIPEPGQVKYKYEVNAKGYEAVDIREDLAGSEKELKAYFNKKLIKENTEYTIDNITSKEISTIDKSVYLSAEINDNTISTVNDDFIYISPFVDQYYDSNPFNDKNRYLPVDFYYPFDDSYILNLKIPEGYEVVEIPENLNLSTEDKKCTLKLSGQVKGDELQLRISFSIKNPFFTAYEYPVLREIYDRYIEKREEQIVLKKKS